jgi:hypothetical protein
MSDGGTECLMVKVRSSCIAMKCSTSAERQRGEFPNVFDTLAQIHEIGIKARIDCPRWQVGDPQELVIFLAGVLSDRCVREVNR